MPPPLRWLRTTWLLSRRSRSSKSIEQEQGDTCFLELALWGSQLSGEYLTKEYADA